MVCPDLRPPRHRLGRLWLAIAAAGVLASAASLGSVRVTQEREDWPDEAARLVRVLALEPGMSVAEIGAGRGELTVQMAKRLGPEGHVFSTEIDSRRLEDIRDAVADASLRNVTVVEGARRTSNLPDGCCDALYMREVYHHFEDPEAMVASLRTALKPGGYMAVIDYPERGSSGANCHCIDKSRLVEQLTSWGFEAITDEDRWSGTRYLAVFRKR